MPSPRNVVKIISLTSLRCLLLWSRLRLRSWSVTIATLATLLLLSAPQELHALGNNAELAALLAGLLVIPCLEFKSAIDDRR